MQENHKNSFTESDSSPTEARPDFVVQNHSACSSCSPARMPRKLGLKKISRLIISPSERES